MLYAVLTITGLILATIALTLAIIALVIVIGLKNSTHQIQILNPVNEKNFKGMTTEDFAKTMKEIDKDVEDEWV